MVHSKVSYGFIDWLGDIGGILELLMAFATFILGGYLSFNQIIETTKILQTSDIYDSDTEAFEGGQDEQTANMATNQASLGILAAPVYTIKGLNIDTGT